MKFYHEELKKIRRKKGIIANSLATQAGITRTTLWKWENGKIIPSEKKTRLLSTILNISVEQISDLQSKEPVSDIVNSGHVSSLLQSFSCAKMSERRKRQSHYLGAMRNQFDEFNQIITVLDSFLNTIDLICYAKDFSSKYIIANRAFLKNLSLDENLKILGRTDELFFPAKEAKLNTKEDEEVISTCKPLSREGYIPGSRKKKWGIISKIPIYDSTGKIAGVLGYFTDITERKKAENYNELLRKCLECMSEGVAISDNKSQKYVFLNDAISKISGYPLETIYDYGRRFLRDNCLLPEDAKIAKEANKFLDRPVQHEFKIQCGDKNGEKWIEDKHSSVITFMGKEFGIAVLADITERKKQEKDRELLNLYVKEAPVGILIIDNGNGKVLYRNKLLINIFEYEDSFEIDRTNWIEKCVHPDDRAMEKEYQKKQNWPAIRQCRVITPSGKHKWLEIKVSKGDFCGRNCDFICVSDITERKNQEILIESFLKCMEMMDEIVWMAEKVRVSKKGELLFDNFLYTVNNKLSKRILKGKPNLSLDELQEYFFTLIIDNDYRIKPEVDSLKMGGSCETKFEIKLPMEHKTLKLREKTYSNKEENLYVGVIKEDKISKRFEKIIEKLRRRGVDDEIIKEAFSE